MFDSPWPSHWEAVVLAWLVHYFIKLATTSMALFGLAAITLLGVGHELAFALAVLLCR